MVAGLLALAPLHGAQAARRAPEVELAGALVDRIESIRRVRSPEQRAAKLLALIAQAVDLTHFEAEVLQDATLSAEERRQLALRFRALLIARAQKLVAEPGEGPACPERRLIRLAAPDQGDVRIECKGAGDKPRTLALWIAVTNGRARVWDASIGGARLSRNWRAIVNKTLRTEGYAAILSKLEAHVR